MSLRSLSVLVGFVLLGCTAPNSLPATPETAPATEEPVLPVENTPAPGEPLPQLAAEFQELRATPGHFSGGTWNDDVDRWRGRKHQLMIALGSQLSTGEYSRATIVQLLGPPDASAGEGDPLFDQLYSLVSEETTADSYEFLVYHWRGTHDFLFFVCKGGTIIDAKWWHAGD